jgi:Uri superfamily endonuclease
MLKGVYTLIIKLQKGRDITIGKLGTISFAAGYYVYVGSALNGLSSRIARHLKSEKSLHWHIDYFLQEARINEVIYSVTTRNKECAVASHLAMRLSPILRFGCSDCHCKSHLYFACNKHFLKKTIYRGFKESSLIAHLW